MPSTRPDVNVTAAALDNRSLLSPIAYDDDAASINSRSDQDPDSDDDELQLRARNSRELRAHDRIVLMQEEELDRLVTDQRREQERMRRGSNLGLPNPFDKILGRKTSFGSLSQAGASNEDLSEERRDSRRDSRRKRRTEKKRKKELIEDAQHGEDGALMHEMEEGGLRDESSTGDDIDPDDGYGYDGGEKGLGSQPQSWNRWIFVYSLIVIGFSILVLAAWKLSNARKAAVAAAISKHHLVSNGTALFGPTTIIISLDGFRADFLQRGLTPRLNALIREGVSAKYMLPSFPSVTFPNHWTLATGLYPEAHGVVGNSFWDPTLGAEFYYTDPSRSRDPQWWGGEPFWVTAEKQGVRSAVHMWPGSEVRNPDAQAHIVDAYNGKEKLGNKVSRILEFLDVADRSERPQLIAAYVPNVDSDGHEFGPNSTEIRSTIAQVDAMLDELFGGLDERNLTGIVNLVVVSDHGMATTDTSRLLQLEDLVDVDKIEHIDGWPLYGLRPRDPADLRGIYEGLKGRAETEEGIDVYLRDEDMPARYHFANNERIAPLWIVPKTGWAVVRRDEFVVEGAREKGLVYHPRGLHGYDHENPLMRAIFIARGPAFPHPANSQIEVFQNIEVYNMVCDSLGIVPSPNNGTLRLPLKPVGTHAPGDLPEVPLDPGPQTGSQVSTEAKAAGASSFTSAEASTAEVSSLKASAEATATSTTMISLEASNTVSSTMEASRTETSIKGEPTGEPKPTASPVPGEDDNHDSLKTLKGVWEWVKDQFGKAWGKFKGGDGTQ